MKLLIQCIVVLGGLVTAIAGLPYLLLVLLLTHAPALTALSQALGQPPTLAIVVAMVLHAALALVFALHLPARPEQCSWQQTGHGLALGASTLVFLVAGWPYLADTAAPGLATFVQAFGVLYAMIVGSTLAALFMGLAVTRGAQALVDVLFDRTDDLVHALRVR